jgi:hypothetical protein
MGLNNAQCTNNRPETGEKKIRKGEGQKRV